MNVSISASTASSPAATPTDPAPRLEIGGFAPFSTCDWPGELVATVFCQGCPWDCGYCHNPHLRPAGAGPIAWEEVIGRLRQRVGLLDGMVFSGGEPTLQSGLPAAMQAVRALGLRVGLHTAGPYPERLARLLPLVDWIGFDAKAPFDCYEAITGVPGSGARARESLGRILAANITCEVRTTVHPALLDEAAVMALAHELAAMGVRDYALQAFRPTGCRGEFVAALGTGAVRPPLGLEAVFPRFTWRG